MLDEAVLERKMNHLSALQEHAPVIMKHNVSRNSSNNWMWSQVFRPGCNIYCSFRCVQISFDHHIQSLKVHSTVLTLDLWSYLSSLIFMEFIAHHSKYQMHVNVNKSLCMKICMIVISTNCIFIISAKCIYVQRGYNFMNKKNGACLQMVHQQQIIIYMDSILGFHLQSIYMHFCTREFFFIHTSCMQRHDIMNWCNPIEGVIRHCDWSVRKKELDLIASLLGLR